MRRWLSRTPAPVFLGALLAGCGARAQVLDTDPDGVDAGADDAAEPIADASVDTEIEATADAAEEPEAAAPSVGLACDGKSGDPKGCPTGLSCYTGGNDPTQDGRWPGGYCTTSCSADSDCAAYGGICAGAGFGGQGQCYTACTQPSDCRKGYACRNVGFGGGGATACAPTGFVATRADGSACFQSTDPTAAHYVATPARTHFGTSKLVDTAYFTSDEVALAIDPQENVIVGANAASMQGNDNPAFYGNGEPPASFKNDSGPRGGNAAYYSDPYLVVGQDGTFYYSTLGINGNATQDWLYVGRSTDRGATWTTVQANPASDCDAASSQGQVCLDHPWLAIGPDKLAPGSEALYAAYLATRANNESATVMVKSTDGGKTWGIPGQTGASLAVFRANDLGMYTNLITPTVADDGVVHLVAVGIGGTQEKGSTQNAVWYTTSADGGKTVGAPVRINPSNQPVPFEQPVVATGNGRVHVAYVAGTPDGAWDIYLATSTDGKTWTRTKLNDEPESCATHFHPAIAIDRASDRVFVGWYDGRFAPYAGLIAMTTCAGDPAAASRCTANEAISDTPFFATTDRTNLLFIGDYFTLALGPNSKLWAGYGSTAPDQVSHAYLSIGAF